MITELGHFALLLAFGVALIQMVVPMVGAAKGWPGWMAVAEPAAGVQVVLVGVSFGALMWAFITSDFSLAVVVANSHSMKPMLYKISGTWGNHEGSMLLWVFIVALFGAMAAWFGGQLPASLRARVLSVQAAIGVAFLAFILLTSNPFARLAVPPFDGQDLNPLLQDPGLAFHPPFLYLGYVGLSMAFSFAVAALRRACRCGMGPMGASVDACRMDLPDNRYRTRLLVGLLRIGLGRFLVLGSG